jgi:hypothetical protein
MPQRKFLAVLLLLLCTQRAYSTTIIIVPTSDGLIVGSDAQIVLTSASLKPLAARNTDTKIFPVGKHVLVASVGIAAGPGYDFRTWIKGIADKLPDDITATELTLILEKESAAKFRNFDTEALASGRMVRQPGEMCRPFVDYLVVGYESGFPIVTDLQFYVNWDTNHLIGPKVIPVYTSKSVLQNTDFYGAGATDAIADFLNWNSYAYKQVALHAPKTLAEMRANRKLNKCEAVALIRTLLGVEHEVSPVKVGGIGKFFQVDTSGLAREIVASDCARRDLSEKAGGQTKRP